VAAGVVLIFAAFLAVAVAAVVFSHLAAKKRREAMVAYAAGRGWRFEAEQPMLAARVEAYPDLKASSNFLDLQRQLTLTEDRIAAARRFYNGNVRSYNTRVQTFPSNLVAMAFGFRLKDFFELQDSVTAVRPA
jgi:LemA protein